MFHIPSTTHARAYVCIAIHPKSNILIFAIFGDEVATKHPHHIPYTIHNLLTFSQSQRVFNYSNLSHDNVIRHCVCSGKTKAIVKRQIETSEMCVAMHTSAMRTFRCSIKGWTTNTIRWFLCSMIPIMPFHDIKLKIISGKSKCISGLFTPIGLMWSDFV